MILVHRLTASLLASLAFLLTLVGSPARSAHAGTYDWESSPNYQFRMWIDDDMPVVYGFYVVFNESVGDTRDLVTRDRYIEWARSMGFGTIGTRFEAPGDTDEDTMQSATLITALENFAAMSGHPEVANAPLLVDGLSLGGHNSVKFAALYPERTIGYMGGAAGRLPLEAVDNPAFDQVPGIVYFGELDTDIDDALARRDDFIPLRRDGARVSFFVQWTFEHERGNASRMGWKILSDMVSLRYPIDQNPTAGPVDLIDIPLESGWVANYDTWDGPLTAIQPYADAEEPEEQFWLPTRDSAFVYRAHATRETPLSFVEPPSDPENPSYPSVQPGDVVPIELSVGNLSSVSMVEVFDGSEPIAQLTAAPYQTSWTAAGIGMHALVAVATLADGSRHTGWSAPVMVLGSAHPGGGTIGDDGGGDDTGADDGTGDTGDDGGDDTGGDDGDNGADGGGGSGGDGGCGCHTGDSTGGAGQLGLGLVAAAALLALRRRGSRRS